MKKLILILMLLISYSLSFAQVEGAETIFKPMSDDEYNSIDYINDCIKDWSYNMKEQYGSDAFHWQGEGFYIIKESWKKEHRYGYGIAFLPVNSQFLTSRFVLSHPCFGGPDMYDCFDCVIGTVRRHKEDFYKKCKADLKITKDFYSLIKKFIEKKRDPIMDVSDRFELFYTSKGVPCYYNLYIIYQDKKGHREYFDMLPAECIDNKMRKDPIINEYIELYDTFDSLFTSAYSDCWWDRFGNKNEIEKQCGQYNLKPLHKQSLLMGKEIAPQ